MKRDRKKPSKEVKLSIKFFFMIRYKFIKETDILKMKRRKGRRVSRLMMVLFQSLQIKGG